MMCKANTKTIIMFSKKVEKEIKRKKGILKKSIVYKSVLSQLSADR